MKYSFAFANVDTGNQEHDKAEDQGADINTNTDQNGQNDNLETHNIEFSSYVQNGHFERR